LPGAIPEDAQQRFHVFTIRGAKDALGFSESCQFPGLYDIPAQEDKKFGLPFGILVTARKYIPAEQGQHFFGRNLLTDARHAQKGTQRPWDGEL
jgi:hypothetical protein